MPISSISEVFKTSTFWTLSGCFFICGVTANGLIGTHSDPARDRARHTADDRGHGRRESWAARVLSARRFPAGWSTGSIREKCSRSSTLCAAPRFLFCRTCQESLGLFLFAVLYGLDWYALGPATTTIIARSSARSGSAGFSAWFLSFINSAAPSAAILGGWARVYFGDYQDRFSGWRLSGLACGLLGADGAVERAPCTDVARRDGTCGCVIQ